MPNASALLAITEAVYTVLNADATLLTLTDAVLGYEPEVPPARFIVVGNATEMAWNTLGGPTQGWGWDDTLTVHLYDYGADGEKTDLRVLQMLGRVTTLLNLQPLTVAGYQTVICEYGEKVTRVLVEEKGKVQRRHIPAIFSIRVLE